MKRSELLGRILVILVCLPVVLIPGWIYLTDRAGIQHARMAENGGWTPQVIQARAGQPLHLRMTSDDVMHSFAVGQMQMDPVDIEPGKITKLTLTFDKPGIYTFYCTRWCGLNHWRMRGTIEVSGEESPAETAGQPLYAALGIDIDAAHPAEQIPGEMPSALPEDQAPAAMKELERILSDDYYRSHSPSQAFNELRDTALTDPQKWNLVAYAWRANTTAKGLEEGRRLFTQNCAACHGTGGSGDGVFAGQLAAAGEASMKEMQGAQDMSMKKPANLADPNSIMGASPALLQGKLLRGGMGTGMPMWGSIFTEKQTWDLVAYIYSLHFRY
jgi:mono/diheme cytochrome c family protein/plastocyanin